MSLEIVEKNLLSILKEIENQENIASHFSGDILDFDETIARLHEYIDVAGEYALAYELIIVLFEKFEFIISGINTVKLLEIGLIMGFKTTREADDVFLIKK
ncbi:hypothetical protein ABE501_20180 [Comamonas testosteroni]